MPCIPIKPYFICHSLGYIEAAIKAEKRHKRGERQYWCPTCNRWRWYEECNHSPRFRDTTRDTDASRKKFFDMVKRQTHRSGMAGD